MRIREVLFYDKNYPLKIYIISTTNILSNKRAREENTSGSSKKPTVETLTPPPLIRQPATLTNVYYLPNTRR